MERTKWHESLYASNLIEASLDPLVAISTEGKITDMNQAKVDITGIEREKLVGSNFYDYFTEPQKARNVYKEVFAKGFITDSPLTFRHKNGKLTDVLFNGSVYKDNSGKVLGAVVVGRDVSSQKLHSKYSLSLIEASLDPLVTINPAGKITDMNEALVNITGFTREKLKGTDFFDYFTEPLKALDVYKEVFAAGFVADSPLTIRHKNGKLTDVLFNGSVYKDDDGNVLGIVIVARDIAEQKWAIELRKVNKELAFQNDEKEKRAAELAIANKELHFQNDEKEKRAAELAIANKELAFQNDEKEKRAAELSIANNELHFQNDEKEKRAAELAIANKELAFQNDEKEKRAAELVIANKNLALLNEVNEKRAAELIIANKELAFQTGKKEKRAAELSIADIELDFQNKEKEKREIANKELEAFSYSVKLASQYSLSLIEASLDPLITISIEGKITDMNEALVNITGISRAKLLGTDFLDYFTEPQKARKVYLEVFEKGYVTDSPLTLRHKDGKLTDVLFNGSVYKDDRGNVMGVVIVARDVTAQKLLSQYSLSLIEASLDPLITISNEGKITDMNEALVNITGMSRAK